MDSEKSVKLQKQVRDNSEDIRKEFLNMKNWEEQMNKADSEIRNAGGDQPLPPIRRKKQATKEQQKPKKEAKDAEPQRIKSTDYTAWNNFDADEACAAIEQESESEDEGEEPLSKEELEKNHGEATKHKVNGNVFVQKKEWAKAIGCYNQAIKIFPYDAVFYANRALCHLKIDNFHSAEADCTAAVQLDDGYVKAYHRRATARFELKQYADAAQDAKRVLKLEPSNKEAQAMLVRINKFIDKAKPMRSNRHGAAGPGIGTHTGRELWGEIPTSKKEETSFEKSEKLTAKLLKEMGDTIISEHGSSIVKTVVELNEKVVQRKKEDSEVGGPVKTESNATLPEWLPESQDDAGIVEVITKPPHQRSKKPLRTVPIEPIEFGAKKQTVEKVPVELRDTAAKSSAKPADTSIRLAETEAEVDVPAAPKTAVQFLLTWKKNKSMAFRYKYFEQIPAKRIPSLFKDSMESDTFSEILNVLKSEFVTRKMPVFDYLKYFSQVKRFRTLLMFTSNTDKENLRVLFEYSKEIEDRPEIAIKNIRVKYEM